jgi:hypothetical protein
MRGDRVVQWLNRKCPTVLIPGENSRSCRSLVSKLMNRLSHRLTTGLDPSHNSRKASRKIAYFRDQNAARFPAHVIQPALEAIHRHNPEFDLNESRYIRLRQYLA